MRDDSSLRERPPQAADGAEGLFHEQSRGLWGLAYRLTGSAEDADDVVQESFARLLASPPTRGQPLRPWLVRVATNLCIDALRRRRRRAYTGHWLPAPAEEPEGGWVECLASPAPDPEARYGLVESATYAFLVALEELGPRQRAALLLRDALGYSAAEAARVLGTSEGNVRVVHLRARRTMERYDRTRAPSLPELGARQRAALERFLGSLLAQDARGLEAILREDVEATTDGGGAYTALHTALRGRARVAKLFLRAALERQRADAAAEIRLVNGLPALWICLGRPVRRQAPRTLIRCDVDDAGRIREIHAILAPRKLSGLRLRLGA
jgi:RNA polymerase sigma-70 factor (ECF subfamily)